MRVGSPASCNSGTACRCVSLFAVFCVLLCAFMLALSGCGDDADVAGPIPIPEPPSPEKTLKILEDAYETKDLDRYAGCLAEGYVHTFVSSGWGIPQEDSLGRELDLEYARKLFENENVGDITADLHISGGPWPTEAGFLFRLEPFVKVEVGEPAEAGTTGGSWAELKIALARDDLPCEPCVYIAFSTWLDVELAEDPADTTSWVISKIHESYMMK